MDANEGGDDRRTEERLVALDERLEALELRVGRVEARLVDLTVASRAAATPERVVTKATAPALAPAAPTAAMRPVPQAPTGRRPGQPLGIQGALCGGCGRRLSPYWTRCQHCGASFTTYQPIVAGATRATAASTAATARGAEATARGAEATAGGAEATAASTAAAAAAPAAEEPRWQTPPAPSVDLRAMADFVERHTGRILATIGGIAGILGVIYLLNVAFERNIIGPEGRVLLGLALGALALGLGAWRMERGDRLLGTVLTPVGLAIVSIAAFAATRLYVLVVPEVGLAIAFASAVAAAVIAIRADSQLVAGFGLVAVLMAPPLLGASPDLVTLAFVGAALLGTTIIAVWRTWRWLPPIAFVLAAPQLAFWLLGDPDPMWPALVAIGMFWLLNAVAAGGEEFRRRRNDLSPTSATLLLADAAFLVWGGFTLLDGTYEVGRGAFLLVVALAHLGLGGYFIVRDGERHLFGLMTLATGIAAITMAVPIQAGGPPVPIAWTAEAAVLAWVAVVRRHPYSAIVSALLFGLAAAHLLLLEYPLAKVPAEVPFLDGAGAALAFFVLGLGVATLIVPERPLRALATTLGVLVLGVAAWVELAGPSLAIGWTVLALVATAVALVVPALRERSVGWQLDGLVPVQLRPSAATGTAVVALLPVAAVTAWLAATAHLLLVVYALPWVFPEGTPFVDPAGLALVVWLAALGATGVVLGDARPRRLLLAVAVLGVAWAMPSEVRGPALVVAWTALGLLPMAIEAAATRWLGAPDRALAPQVLSVAASVALPAAAAVAAVAATLQLVLVEYGLPPAPPAAWPFLDPAGLSLALYLVALGGAAVLSRERLVRDGLVATGLLVAALAVYDQLAGIPLVAAWAGLVVAAAAAWRWLPAMPAGPVTTGLDTRAPDAPRSADVRDLVVPVAGLVVGAVVTAYVLVFELPLAEFGRSSIPEIPFTDTGAAAGAILAAMAVLVGAIAGMPLARRIGLLAAGSTVAYLVPFEVLPWATVVLWAALAVLFAYGARIDRVMPLAFLAGAAVLLGAAAVTAVVFVAPPSRLVVDVAVSATTLVTSFLALASVTAALVAIALLHPVQRLVRWLEVAAGIAAIYTFSVAAVDTVATQVGGSVPIEELRWWGQLALSVLWTVGGVAAFVVGVVRDRPLARAAGLALLGIATIKVFLVDLSVLDIAFRAIALIAFAVLVLGSAWVWQHFRPHGPTAAPHAPAS